MPQTEHMEVLVLVKAAPVMTSSLDETMCVAGVRIDGGRNEWVRLHPVPFRDLTDTSRFVKYQRIEVTCIPHNTDRRPETWTPIHGSIVPHETITTKKRWAARRPYIELLGETTMCDLLARNKTGSGPGVPSLAAVRPVDPPIVVMDSREEEQLKRWKAWADAALATPSLFDDPERPKPPFEVVPWRYRYHYRCGAPSCPGHKQTIVDREVVALWRHVQRTQGWEEAVRKKFEDELWTGRDSLLFVGNMEQYPNSFLVLGVFWPPVGQVQGALAL